MQMSDFEDSDDHYETSEEEISSEEEDGCYIFYLRAIL